MRGDSLVIVSRHGERFPFEKAPGTFRIVCFGGSTTENAHTFLESGITYPKRMGEHLHEKTGRAIEVINVANSAYATPHSLIHLELDVLSWSPDVVVLSHNINDLLASYWPGFRPDYANKYGDEFYNVPDLASRFTTTNALFQHSELYWYVKNWWTARGREDPHLIRRASYPDTPDSLARAVFERNLRSFATLARANGVAVVFGTQPLEPSDAFFVRHLGAKPYNARIRYPDTATFARHHAAFNDILARVAVELDVTLVDAAAALDGDRRYFIDLVHYTREGVDRLAEVYADALAPLIR